MDSYTTKLAVRDSLDDDDLSDVDDEVFIRDGKTSSKLVEDRGVKRPLMAPRRKVCKEGTRIRHPPCRIKCVFYCYAAIALLVLLGLIGLTVLLVSLYPLPVDRIRPWFSSSPLRPFSNSLLRPCTSFRVTNIWNITIPKRSTESPIRSIDVNQDGIKDIIFGFQTENGEKPFPYLCLIYFPKQIPCQGGVMALDGANGTILWEHWTAYPVYYLDCTGDLNGDNNLDCIAMGRGGLLCAIDGLNGTLIWQFNSKIPSKYIIDFTVGQIIPDQDGDGVVDIIGSHTIQKGKARTGHIFLISGKTGKKIIEIPTPRNKEIYFMPQLIKHNGKNLANNTASNSTQVSQSSKAGVLFGTGGQETPGGLYIFPLNGFSTKKNIPKPTLLYQDKHKGLLSPAVLVDITGDLIDDIIFVTFNGTVIAMDGINYKQIWNYTFNYSESSAAIVPGYFNDDNITDFMIKFNVGNGFPEYFYSQTLLLDGKTGTDLLHKWVIDSAPNDLAGLSISVQNTGLDIFLYWIGVCKGYEDSSEIFDEFNFVLGNSIWAESRVDICKLRFNTTLVLKLYALNQYEEPPGVLIYSTENINSEYNSSYSALHEAKKFLDEHPKFQFSTLNRQHSEVPAVNDLLENIEENTNSNLYQSTNINNGGSSFRHKIPGEGLIREFNKNEFGNRPHGTHTHIEGEETLLPDEWSQEGRTPLDWGVNDQYPQEGSLALEPNLSLQDEDIYDDDIETRNPDRNSYGQQNRDARSKDTFDESQKENQTTSTTVENKIKRDDSFMEIKVDDIDEDEDNENENIDSLIRKRLLKDLSMYDEYTNIQNSRNRLLHDLSNVPSAILRQSYLENAQKNLNAISDELENKLIRNRNGKFEQRDLRYRQNDHMSSVKKQLETIYDEKRRESLWDLESEKEEEDKAHGYWRGKREMIDEIKHVPKIDSTGILLKPLKNQENSIDYVFAKFWMPIQNEAQILLPADKECVAKKLVAARSPENQYYNIEMAAKRDLFIKMCLESRGIQLSEIVLPISGNSKLDESPYLKDVIELSLGQLTVQRINIQCDCGPLLDYEVCGQILPIENQRWSEYMGRDGEGYFKSWNKIVENSNTYV